jgi:hypothetical protein
MLNNCQGGERGRNLSFFCSLLPRKVAMHCKLEGHILILVCIRARYVILSCGIYSGLHFFFFFPIRKPHIHVRCCSSFIRCRKPERFANNVNVTNLFTWSREWQIVRCVYTRKKCNLISLKMSQPWSHDGTAGPERVAARKTKEVGGREGGTQ